MVTPTDRRQLAALGLEAMTEREKEWILAKVDSAIRRASQTPIFRNAEGYQAAVARRDALRRHLARRRFRVLPGGRR